MRQLTIDNSLNETCFADTSPTSNLICHIVLSCQILYTFHKIYLEPNKWTLVIMKSLLHLTKPWLVIQGDQKIRTKSIGLQKHEKLGFQVHIQVYIVGKGGTFVYLVRFS